MLQLVQVQAVHIATGPAAAAIQCNVENHPEEELD
jgi:hypothetical protein